MSEKWKGKRAIGLQNITAAVSPLACSTPSSASLPSMPRASTRGASPTSDPATSDPATSDPATSDPATSDPATSDPATALSSPSTPKARGAPPTSDTVTALSSPSTPRATTIEFQGTAQHKHHSRTWTTSKYASSPTSPSSPRVRRAFTIHTSQPRPHLVHKSATAPAGTIRAVPLRPQLPRRAISARVAGPCLTPRRNVNNAVSLGGTSSRSLLRAKKGKARSVHRTAHTPVHANPQTPKQRAAQCTTTRRSPLKPVSPGLLARYEGIARTIEGKPSFSAGRVRETLKRKGVSRIETRLRAKQFPSFGERALPETPGSMGRTPRELYSAEWWSREEDKENLGDDSAWESVLSLGQEDQENEDASTWIVYIPGPILLHTVANAARHSNSASVTQPPHDNLAGSRALDDAAVEDVISYFTDWGLLHEATYDELDLFWLSAEKAEEDLNTGVCEVDWASEDEETSEGEKIVQTVLDVPGDRGPLTGTPMSLSPSSKAFKTLGMDQAGGQVRREHKVRSAGSGSGVTGRGRFKRLLGGLK